MRHIGINLLIVFLLLLINSPLFSIGDLDSLKTEINSYKDEYECLYKIEKKLPSYIRARDADAKEFLFGKGFEIANKLKADTSIAYLYLQKGTDEYFKGNYIKSKEYFKTSIDKYSDILDKNKTVRVIENEANAYNNLGIISKKQALYTNALMNYQIALKLRKSINDSVQIANTYLNIGNLHNTQRNIIKSKEYYLKARNTYLNLGNNYGLASANHNLGLVHEYLGEYEEALKSYKESYQIYMRLDRKKTMGISLNNIGNVFLILNKRDSVLPYLDSAYSIFSTSHDTVGICNVYMNYGNYFSQTGDNQNAIKYLEGAIDIARDQKLLDKEVNTAKILANHYSINEDYKNAYKSMYLVDSLENEFRSDTDEERFQRLDEYYKDEAKNQSIAIKELELKNSKANLKNNRIFSFILIVLLAIIVSLLVFLFVRYKTTNAIKLELENTNKQLQQINKDYRLTLISKDEKEILLQEIHHRVKNNLQIINSLLRFQAMKGNSETKELILELQTRITAMALLHEQLYMNDDFTKINVKDYIELLLSNLSSAYARTYAINIEQEINIENLDLDTLHPLGLLINEIVSNSLKHAFNKDIKSCKIYLKLYKSDDYCNLEVGDNGIGFDPQTLVKDSSNLGIELISSLINQLEGELINSENSGTHYHVKFKSGKEA